MCGPSLTSVTTLEPVSGSCQRPNRRCRDDDQNSQAKLYGDEIKWIYREEQNLIEVNVLYYEASKFHENDPTVVEEEEVKAGILPWKDMQNTSCTTDIYSAHYITIASKKGEDVLSTLRKLKHQVKELRDDNKALRDDNREVKSQPGTARSSHRTAALLSSRAADDPSTGPIYGGSFQK